MIHSLRRLFPFLLLAALGSRPADAGGAWLPAKGVVDLQLGYSQKEASSSWDSRGVKFSNFTTHDGHRVRHYHDFRYGFLSTEIGLHDRVSFRFTGTYLHGLEGPAAELEKNTGPSDAWLGFKVGLSKGSWPMALGLTMRTPYLYDQPGAYSRYLYSANGTVRGVSPEWRGVLKEDYTLTYLVSRSLGDGRGWVNVETGYTYRRGAPSDEIPFYADGGWELPWWRLQAKGTLTYIQTVGNSTPAEPDDRFRSRPGFDFNNASHARVGLGLRRPFGRDDRFSAELGWNQWVWGKSARQYQEPYFSFGYQF